MHLKELEDEEDDEEDDEEEDEEDAPGALDDLLDVLDNLTSGSRLQGEGRVDGEVRGGRGDGAAGAAARPGDGRVGSYI